MDFTCICIFSLHTKAVLVVVVCRCDSLPQGGLDHRYMDLADTFFHMGFDPALVHIYVDLQVCISLIL